MTVLRVVGAAVFRHGLCLVAKRGVSMRLAGKWEFPGGKIEPSESPEEALARELAEELGVQAEIGVFLGRGTALIGPRAIELVVFAAKLIGGEPSSREHEEIRWVTADDLSDLDWAEADIPIVTYVQQYMRLIAGRKA